MGQADVIEWVAVGGDHQRDDLRQDWLFPRRRPGMPAPGVVTQREQLDEEHAFGLAVPLVDEWRELRVGCDLADQARVSAP